MITAARDLATVRAAMRGGAVYYLVKPFGFEQLQTQLDSYRRWRQEADTRTVADQAAVDQLFNLRSAPSPATGSRRLPPTMQKVLDTVVHAGQPISASDIADRDRNQPAHGPEVPQRTGTQGTPATSSGLRRDRKAGEHLPAPQLLVLQSRLWGVSAGFVMAMSCAVLVFSSPG